jgi:uncharacterized protein YkwD
VVYDGYDEYDGYDGPIGHARPRRASRRGPWVWGTVAVVGAVLAGGAACAAVAVTAGPAGDTNHSRPLAVVSPSAETPSLTESPSLSPSASPSRRSPSPKPSKKTRTPSPSQRSSGSGGDGGGSQGSGPTGTAGQYARQVVSLVNDQRSQNGCGPLSLNSKLTLAAQRHTDDMVARHFFSHTNPDGVDFSTRISRAGYTWSTAGENIAAGQPTPAAVMDAWMHSPGHRANILNCAFKDIGVGVNLSGTPTWTQDFAAP